MASGGGLSDGSLDAFLDRLADDHRQVLSIIAAQSAQALQREERRVMVTALRELQREHQELAQELSILTGNRLRMMVGEDATPPPLPEVPDFPVVERDTKSENMQIVAKPAAPPGRPRGPRGRVFRDALHHTRSDEELFASMPVGSMVVGEVVTDTITSTHVPPPVLKRATTRSAWDLDDTMSVTAMQRDQSMLEPVADVKRKLLRKQRLRLRTLFGLRVCDQWVSAETLQAFIARRYPSTNLDVASVQELIAELKKVRISQRLFQVASDANNAEEDDDPGRIGFNLLVELILDPDLLRFVHPERRDDIDWFSKMLLAVTVEEIIDNATNVHGSIMEGDDEAPNRSFLRAPKPISVLRGVIPFTVIMSITCLALSLDVSSRSRVWVVAEVFFTAIFVTEVVVKMLAIGPSGYFCRKERRWNTLDFIVTSLSVIDVAINLYQLMQGSISDAAARLLPLLRALRISRVFRLAKLLRTKFAKNFTNMLTGFMLGLPALFGVLFLFLVVLFVLGLAFRIMWGPEDGQNFIGECGEADDYLDNLNQANRTAYCDSYVHYMYGEEFFGSVWLSMFTTFRFMLGDYQSKQGISLAIVFGAGYGWGFHLLFGVGMICCVFGLFNIVTAIFVDSTISGLKHNDIMRKYAQQYEGRYVKAKLMALIHRVAEIMEEQNCKGGRRQVSAAAGRLTVVGNEQMRQSDRSVSVITEADNLEELEKLVMTFDDFCEIMEDQHVRGFLRDLDVEMYNPASFFETFDADDTGVITITVMVQNIIRLRGEVRKNDMIASLVAVRALGKRFDQLTLAMDSKNTKVVADRIPTDSAFS